VSVLMHREFGRMLWLFKTRVTVRGASPWRPAFKKQPCYWNLTPAKATLFRVKIRGRPDDAERSRLQKLSPHSEFRRFQRRKPRLP
jgi:hypothetical protein